jgi:MFS transporter, DHA2 family, multidrug resistance protein
MTAAPAKDLVLHEHDHGLHFNPWLVALTVTMATFMEVLDTSIANVSLPHIAGSLASTPEESTWVLTSYLVSNAVVLPLSGWMSGVIGRKRFNMLCVLLFTMSSALCGMAGSLRMLILFRVLQGVGGGGLQPSVQAILIDTFPPYKRGMAMAVYALAIMVAPVIGPTMGGWITDNYSWRWIFYINVPVGIVSLILTQIMLQDPPHLVAARLAMRGKPLRIDYIGLGLIAVGLATLEIALDQGQEKDWFASSWIVFLIVTAVITLVSAVFWELWHPEPIVNLRLFKDRNFGLCCLVIFFVFAVLYGTTVLLPEMLQTLMGYSATAAGWVLSPAGLVAMAEMPIIGILLSRGFDARKMIVIGLLFVAAATYWMSHLNLQVSESQVIWPRIVQVMGAGLMFVPINTVAYRFIPRSQTGNASGLFALIRNEAASIGVATVTTLLQRHTQVHQQSLIAHINLLNPLATDALHRISSVLDPTNASGGAVALRVLYGEIQRQAGVLSYLEMFRMFSLATVMVIPLVMIMRRSTATAGAMAAH